MQRDNQSLKTSFRYSPLMRLVCYLFYGKRLTHIIEDLKAKGDLHERNIIKLWCGWTFCAFTMIVPYALIKDQGITHPAYYLAGYLAIFLFCRFTFLGPVKGAYPEFLIPITIGKFAQVRIEKNNYVAPGFFWNGYRYKYEYGGKVINQGVYHRKYKASLQCLRAGDVVDILYDDETGSSVLVIANREINYSLSKSVIQTIQQENIGL